MDAGDNLAKASGATWEKRTPINRRQKQPSCLKLDEADEKESPASASTRLVIENPRIRMGKSKQSNRSGR
ncbi:hypothetical protein F2Q69_00024537 [Brassica cretica]|uniref:Uncharacterized protein n=1 Tax=Brassica cretica TaxID=69181 RepID=A0A8S9Q6Z6_BRACR|nr:hypothetical protein F2Q69_00024537 [Brassica cretica]